VSCPLKSNGAASRAPGDPEDFGFIGAKPKRAASVRRRSAPRAPAAKTGAPESRPAARKPPASPLRHARQKAALSVAGVRRREIFIVRLANPPARPARPG
jgi:hypothetical protein